MVLDFIKNVKRKNKECLQNSVLLGMNVKEKIKIIWKNFTENWLWVTIGVYIGTTLMGWIEYFRGFLPLIGVLLPTFLIPLFLFGIYYVRKLNSRTIYRLIWTVGGASAMGFPIWLFVNYILFVAPWAPFRGYHGILSTIIFILGTVLSYGGAAYIMDKLGKKRDFRPFM